MYPFANDVAIMTSRDLKRTEISMTPTGTIFVPSVTQPGITLRALKARKSTLIQDEACNI